MSSAQTRRLLYAAAWLPCLTIYFVALLINKMPPGASIRGAIAGVLPAALLGILVLRLAIHLRWDDRRKARFFLAHGAALIGFMLGSTGSFALLVGIDEYFAHGKFVARIDPRVIPWRMFMDLLMYSVIASIAYAWQNAARAAKAEALRARAALQAMRSQLNPHFILNTFHALVGLVRRDPALAEQALERLGDLLRYSLRIQREELDEVVLRDELSFVQSYLDLERLRLGDRLQVTFDADAPALDTIVPSFAVQTLVENAVRHAIAPRADGGHVAVTAHRVNGRLHIKVQDDGRGVDDAERGNGLGLSLLQERLTALYEGDARIDVQSTPNGVSASLVVPVRDV